MTKAMNKAHELARTLCEFAAEDGTAMDFETILDGVFWNMRDNCYIGMGDQITTGAQNGYVAYAVEHMREDMVRSMCEFLNFDTDSELAQLAW